MPDARSDQAEVRDAESATQHYISQRDDQPMLVNWYTKNLVISFIGMTKVFSVTHLVPHIEFSKCVAGHPSSCTYCSRIVRLSQSCKGFGRGWNKGGESSY